MSRAMDLARQFMYVPPHLEQNMEKFYRACREDQIREDARIATKACFDLNVENCGMAAAVVDHAIMAQLKNSPG